MGRNGNNANYAYVLITEKGEIVKKFILSEYVLGFSNDLRYFVYQSSLPNNIKWGDMNDERTSHPLIDGCNQPTWSKDNLQLSMLCHDGIHLFELRAGNWIEKAIIARPDELKSVPEEYNEDFIFLKYPLWMQNGFAFFVDYSGMIYGGSDHAPQNLYFLGKECINDSRMCDLSKPTMVLAGGAPPVTAVALSSDDRLLAIVVSNETIRELRIYDFLSQTVVQKFDLIKFEQNNRSTVDSMVWIEHDKQLLFSMTAPSRIVGIDLSKEKDEIVFNCSEHQVFDCSILSTVTIN